MDRGALDEAVERIAARHGTRHVGLVVGAVTSEGARFVVPVGRVRAPDGPPPRADSLFEIGSVTKVFTALLLAVAVTRGELSLDTPVADLLPEVVVPTRDGVAITVEHLATHTAGLPNNPMPLAAAIRAQWKARNGDPWEAFDRAALLTALAGTTLRRTPGTGRIAYSNLGAGVLGHALVAAAATRDFGELVRSRICDPLGMADTVLLPDREQSEREAVGHRSRRRTTGHWRVAGLPGAGALRSTATDVLTFLQAQLRPEDTPLGPAIALTHPERRPGSRLGIGLGWLRVPMRGGRVLLWHNGGTGGFRAFAGFVPAAGVGVVALANDVRSVDRVGFDLLTALSGQPMGDRTDESRGRRGSPPADGSRADGASR
ncbi:beta-lactamase family protein [Geodermatophilus sabuli]|uniref:Beta-lactamase family protein n=1 Tax=Geodermatophilus sabuli TaxID=1564158 RepID=A0A7K3VVT2_9ACTN|nr:serine hydrolase domain-containing protein [Geodermatophilus sabuli]NEK56749.1 beta-lactamase family protein [Geodermatophilus sabuli]